MGRGPARTKSCRRTRYSLVQYIKCPMVWGPPCTLFAEYPLVCLDMAIPADIIMTPAHFAELHVANCRDSDMRGRAVLGGIAIVCCCFSCAPACGAAGKSSAI